MKNIAVKKNPRFLRHLLVIVTFLFLICLLFVIIPLYVLEKMTTQTKQKELDDLKVASASLEKRVVVSEKATSALKNQDQYKINQQLKEDIKNTHDTYKKTIELFEKIQDLKAQKQKTDSLENLYSASVKDLEDLSYASSAAKIDLANKEIDKINAAIAAAAAASAGQASQPSTTSNSAPAGGFSYQSVQSSVGTFAVSIVAGDLGSTRVIVDTASDSDCRDNCPVLSLGDYVSRNGAYAGINGSYFCPASYPSCAGKTNSFDLLVMNKNKKYFNSDNNVYSTNPAVIFSNGSIRFVGQASGWGRDTGVDGVLSNFPLLVSGNQVVFGGDGDPKKGSKGSRSFVANKGNTVYIGVVYGATVAEAAHALKTLGMDNAMNLDSGGSTALWYSGYKAGPGRAIPNAILFVRK